MNIVAMLAWWDEPPDELDACVRSLTVLCDTVVAVDGAYQMTPGATATSPTEQVAAIRDAAADTGLQARIIVPSKIWAGQVEKRNLMIREASADADWVIAVDADHRLVGERTTIRDELARTTADSIRHDFYTPPPAKPSDLRKISPHPWHTGLSGRTIEHSLLLRALADMRVETDHWGYSGVRDGTRFALGNWRGSRLRQGTSHRLRAPFRVEHVCFQRDRMRLDRNRDYCKVRDAFRRRNGYEP